METLYILSSEGQLYHAFAGAKKDHKYVAKVPVGGNKNRYFYSQDEYQTYLNGKQKTETPKAAKPSTRAGASSGSGVSSGSGSTAASKVVAGRTVMQKARQADDKGGYTTGSGALKETTSPPKKVNVTSSTAKSVVKSENILSKLGNMLKQAPKNLGDNVKKAGSSAIDSLLGKVNENTKKLDSIVKQGQTLIGSFLNDEDNKYVVNSANYKRKLETVKETDEWKAIVARKDPEYVRQNKDGSTSYLIDDYLVDKKHPVLDVLGDIAAGRKVDTNEITMESSIAGLKDYATKAINTGMLSLGLVTTYMTESFKLSQGSYDDKIDQLSETVERGAAYVDQLSKKANNVRSSASYNISTADAQKLLATINASTNASSAKSAIDEDDIVRAVQVLVESDAMKKNMGNNEYYQMAERTLSGLSQEEIALINLIYREAIK